MDVSIPLAAFGLGVALGASPGPVQLLLFSEASRGGAGRGLRAMAGANATFGLMMLLLAAGLSSLEPGETFLRVVKVIGGAFLVFLAGGPTWSRIHAADCTPASGGSSRFC
jgi:threonine/homoserine/homoserine lactone efflux protein